jgi:hypothetical protein
LRGNEVARPELAEFTPMHVHISTHDPLTAGHCVDGFCCDSACKGPCESCSAAEKGSGTNGTCGPLAAGAGDRIDRAERVTGS